MLTITLLMGPGGVITCCGPVGPRLSAKDQIGNSLLNWSGSHLRIITLLEASKIKAAIYEAIVL